jgi:hypothetical protein
MPAATTAGGSATAPNAAYLVGVSMSGPKQGSEDSPYVGMLSRLPSITLLGEKTYAVATTFRAIRIAGQETRKGNT